MLKLLLFLWMPLSVSVIQGLGQGVGMGMTLQHMLILSFVFAGMISGFLQGEFFSLKRIWLYVGLAFLHFLIFFYSADIFIKLLAVVAVIQWAYTVSNNFTLKEFVQISAYSSIVFFIFSIVFVLLFPDSSRQYFWGEYVLSSFYGHKNGYGRFLFTCFSFCFFHYLLFKRSWMIAFLVMIPAVMLFSGSRSSLGLALLTVFMVVLIYMRLFGAKMFVLSLAAFIAFMGVGIATGNIHFIGIGSALDGVRIYGVDAMLTGRATIWASVFYQLALDDKWWWGYGLDYFFNSSYMVNQAFGEIGLGNFMPADSHNGYIDTILSYGVVGLLIWFVLMLSLIMSEKIKHLTFFEKVFLFVSLVSYLGANMTESFIVKSTNYMCFLFYYLFFKFLADKRAPGVR